MHPRHVPLAVLALFAVACSGDSTPKPAAANAAGTPAVSPDDYRKAQQAYADSILNKTSSSSEIAKEMGEGYQVGSVRLRDSLGVLANNSNCFAQGRGADPYLAGTVSWYVFMSPVGSNIVRIQKSDWTSAAGRVVDACLNLEAKNWKFDTSFGKPAAYITQVQFK